MSIRTFEIEHLKLQIAKLNRVQFGRKSENLDWQIGRLEARLEDLVAEEGIADANVRSDPPSASTEQQGRLTSLCWNTCRVRTMCSIPSRRSVLRAIAISSRWAKMTRSIWIHCDSICSHKPIVIRRKRIRDYVGHTTIFFAGLHLLPLPLKALDDSACAPSTSAKTEKTLVFSNPKSFGANGEHRRCDELPCPLFPRHVRFDQ
ncbi:hypothetical protein [Burkholderia sp. Leaf177]|uniref:IS66 family transposase n=1 Tax=Burkholderia sp. Leaf177 TaxID=1736287 RepID=UPI00138EDCE4